MKETIRQLYAAGILAQDNLVIAICKNILTVDDVQDIVVDEEATFAIAKAARIKQTKTSLETYLETHPIQWINGKYYSITSQKQQWLTSKLFAATTAQSLGQPYDLKWNDTNEICTEWELSDLWALSQQIDARVSALVTYQQAKEVELRNTNTLEELLAVEVDFDSVASSETSTATEQ